MRLPIGPDECVGAIEGDEFGGQCRSLPMIQAANEKIAERRIMVVMGMKMLTPFFS